MFKFKNQKIALVLFLFSLFYLIMSFNLPRYPYVPVDSNFVPIGLGFILMGLSVGLYFVKDKPMNVKDKMNNKIPKQDLFVLLTVTFMVIVYISLIEVLGFILSTAIFVFICSWFLGYKKHVLNLLFSFIFPVAVYYLFTVGLQVQLPKGILPF